MSEGLWIVLNIEPCDVWQPDNQSFNTIDVAPDVGFYSAV
jgi:hypothetical protein